MTELKRFPINSPSHETKPRDLGEARTGTLSYVSRVGIVGLVLLSVICLIVFLMTALQTMTLSGSVRNLVHGGGTLKYATFDGTDWRVETVDGTGDAGHYVSLALAEDGRVHIGYYDGYPNYALKHATLDDSAWQIHTVDTAGDVGQHASIAIDSVSGAPHLSYFDRRRRSLKYASFDQGHWRSQAIERSNKSGQYTSLKIDDKGMPRIGYFDETDQALGYAWLSDTTWYSQTVDDSGDRGRFTSLALDQNGEPHISYYDADNKALKYAWLSDTTWYSQTVDDGDDVGRFTSLALDQDGKPHISYLDASDEVLKHAWLSDTNWCSQTVDRTGRVGGFTSIALRDDGSPCISYFSRGQGAVKYAWLSKTNWLSSTVADVGLVKGYSSLALDPASGQPRIACFNHVRASLPGLLRDFWPVTLVLVWIPVVASRFLRATYGLKDLEEAHGHLHRSLFGLSGFQPHILVKEGRIAAGEDHPLVQAGGPGSLLVYHDSAVVLEQGGRLTRVCGSGFHRLRRFERVWEVIDLRPQHQVVQVEALTKEGIPVRCEADITFRIDGDHKRPTAKAPFPYREEAVLQAALSTWILDPNSDRWRMRWPARVTGMTMGILRDIISSYRLDRLAGSLKKKEASGRKAVKDELEQELSKSVRAVGATLLSAEMGRIEFDLGAELIAEMVRERLETEHPHLSSAQIDELATHELKSGDLEGGKVSGQWIKAWKAKWRRDVLLRQAEGEAELARLEAAQVQAQAEMIVAFAEALQPLMETQEHVSPYLVAFRLVETLRWISFDPWTRTFLPPETTRFLDMLQDTLAGGIERPSSSREP